VPDEGIEVRIGHAEAPGMRSLGEKHAMALVCAVRRNSFGQGLCAEENRLERYGRKNRTSKGNEIERESFLYNRRMRESRIFHKSYQ
jgi:hypothetical protein